jgi:hypothetical protein
MILRHLKRGQIEGFLFKDEVSFTGYKFSTHDREGFESFNSAEIYYRVYLDSKYLQIGEFVCDFVNEQLFAISFLIDNFLDANTDTEDDEDDEDDSI